MSFFSLLAVFILEQIQPLSYRRLVRNPLMALAAWTAKLFNVGTVRHGVLATLLVLIPLCVLVLLAYGLLYAMNPLLAWGLNVVVLYLTMGFRQFSHHYTAILEALQNDELDIARKLLADWRFENGIPRDDRARPESAEEIARASIELALLGAHRHVFAVLLWFILLPGPVGAILYRTSAVLAEAWKDEVSPLSGEGFGAFAIKLFAILEWLPVRATAAAFAIVGNFEDAVYCAREQASAWADRATGIILASASGALGVRLSTQIAVRQREVDVLATDYVDETPEEAPPFGEVADVNFMQSAVGLVWRATVLWVLLLFLLGLASVFG